MKKSEFIQQIAEYLRDRENEYSPEDQAKELFDFIDKHMMPRNMIKVDLFDRYDNGWKPESDN
jgi:hypothetical protein